MESQLNILIVDDDEVDRMAIRRTLHAAGIDASIDEAHNARDALAAMRDVAYSCVFLDYLLPDGDGLALLERVRASGVSSPIVMLTGHGDELLAVKLMQSGASDYLPKALLSPGTLAHSVALVTRMHHLESKRLQAEEALRESNELVRDILECISDAFLAVDGEWRLTYLNRQAELILRAARVDLVGRPLTGGLTNLEPWFRHAMEQAMACRETVVCEGYSHPHSMWLEAHAYPVKDGVSVYFRDITERKRAEERLNYLANYDALTGLPNRALMTDRLNQVLTRLPWRNRVMAVMFCDLDRFKIVNDTLGHDVGDRLLVEVADRLKSCVRAGDTVARLGGDEFVILLADVAKEEDVVHVAQKIIAQVSAPVLLEGHELYVSASIGISIYPADGSDASVLLKSADIAMYRAKQLGKNTYQLYSPVMNTKAVARLSLESAMRRGIERDEFLLHYQPLIDVAGGGIVGAEALVRWRHPELGLVSPADFLPLAEETGLIVPIGERLLHLACAQLGAWQRDGHAGLRVAVNLSDRQFKQDNLAAMVEQALRDYGLAAQSLELELTEDIIMHGIQHAAGIMETLRAMDIKMAIDDFGTGYSSLGRLRSLPIHTLKIDRSFINQITSEQHDGAIVEAILALAHKLGLRVVAEGVETREQYECLKAMRCDELQGYYFSRPLPAGEFTALLARQKSRQVTP